MPTALEPFLELPRCVARKVVADRVERFDVVVGTALREECSFFGPHLKVRLRPGWVERLGLKRERAARCL